MWLLNKEDPANKENMLNLTSSPLDYKKLSIFYFLLAVGLFVIVIVLLVVVILPDSDNFFSNYARVLRLREVLKNNEAEQHTTDSATAPPKTIGIPILFINLARSQNRLERIKVELQHIGSAATRIEAVDGRNIDSLEHSQLTDSVQFTNKLTNCRKEELACMLSHSQAILMAFQQNLEQVLIVEDDAMFGLYYMWTKSIPEILQELDQLDPEWQVLQLFSNSPYQNSATEHFTKTSPYSGTVAYIIHQRGIQQFIDKTYRNGTWVFTPDLCDVVVADKFLYEVCDKSYVYYRALIYTDDIDSTIAEDRRGRSNNSSSHILQMYVNEHLRRSKQSHASE